MSDLFNTIEQRTWIYLKHKVTGSIDTATDGTADIQALVAEFRATLAALAASQYEVSRLTACVEARDGIVHAVQAYATPVCGYCWKRTVDGTPTHSLLCPTVTHPLEVPT